MHIGLDIDGTITRCPAFFSVVSRALMAAGHRVSILSFREDREFAEEDLAECGVFYDELILPTEKEYQRIVAEGWRQGAAMWKAGICHRLKIDLMFDDMPEVINALGDGTVGFLVAAERELL